MNQPQIDLDAVAAAVRELAGLRSKAAIAVVAEVFGGGDWLHGPGDDGAALAFGDAHVVACGEALLPSFVAHDPYGAGIAAVLTNVNDLAAMGARPLGIVDTIVADEPTAREILRGIRYGCQLYDVPLLGGHLTDSAGPPALSAFGLGRAQVPLSVQNVSPGQTVLLGCSLAGQMRTDFPFFRGFAERSGRAAGDVRLLAELAEAGVCVAAKDVSMAGVLGSLAMLLERGRHGVTVDLAAVPVPAGVELTQWLTCFPNYAFLLCCPPGQEQACRRAFHARDLTAEVIGTIDDTGLLQICQAGRTRLLLDLNREPITGLR